MIILDFQIPYRTSRPMKRLLKYAASLVLSLIIIILLFLLAATLTDFRPEEKISCEVTGRAEGRMPSDSIFTVQTWNLGYFGLGKDNDFFYDGGKMTRPSRENYLLCSKAGVDYISNSPKSDFYFFQELDLDSKRSYHDDQLNRLMSALPGFQACVALNYKVFYVPLQLTDPQGKVNSGIITFSRIPSKENTRYAFPGGFAWPVGLFMLDRCFLLSRISLGNGRDLVMINTHNDAFDDGSLRKQQMAVLKDIVLTEYGKGNYVVTGGDWNLNPPGYDPLKLATGDPGFRIEPAIEPDFLPADWKWAYDAAIPSNRSVAAPYHKDVTKITIIDFFVVSPNIEVLDIKTEDLGFNWSDHQPVKMKFKLN